MALVIGGRISSSSDYIIMMLVAILLTAAGTMTISASFNCGGIWVYPFESLCTSPARYYGEEVYELVGGPATLVQGKLAPEGDEGNFTNFVRLAEEGAKYRFEHWYYKFEPRIAVAKCEDVRIVNVETERALGWRRKGENEWFLVEVAENEAPLRFDNYVGRCSFPCPLIYPPWSCGVYTILDYGTALSLTPYVENNATYFKLTHLSETDRFPFRLRKISSIDIA